MAAPVATENGRLEADGYSKQVRGLAEAAGLYRAFGRPVCVRVRAEEVLVDAYYLLRDRGPGVERASLVERLLREAPAQGSVVEHEAELCGEALGASGLGEQGVLAVAKAVHNADGTGGDYRKAGGHRFQDGVREALGEGRGDKYVAPAVDRGDLVVGSVAEIVDPALEAELADAAGYGVGVRTDAGTARRNPGRSRTSSAKASRRASAPLRRSTRPW